jgi:hypothetical protein
VALAERASLANAAGCGALRSAKMIMPDKPIRPKAEATVKAVNNATLAKALVISPLHSELDDTVKYILDEAAKFKWL